MTAIDAGAPRARPMATDLDGSGPHPRRPTLPVPSRTRHALHLMGPLGKGEPRESDLNAVRSGRSAAGIPGATASAWLDPAVSLNTACLHGVHWTDYPVVGDPRFSPVRGFVHRASFAHAASVTSSTVFNEVALQADSVVVHLPVPSDPGAPCDWEGRHAWLWRANVFVEAIPEAEAHLVDAEGRRFGGAPELAAMAAGIAPWMRFLHSYAANYLAIAYKAHGMALTAPDEPAFDLVRCLKPRTEYDAARFHELQRRMVRTRDGFPPDAVGRHHPLALQVLYSVRRRGSVPLRGPIGTPHGVGWEEALVCPGEGASPAWRGTGRHAPRPLSEPLVISTAHALVHGMFLRREGPSLVLSRTGEAFLDLLHPACEDADLMCRWGHAPAGPGDGEAMDAWIARTFRKLKTRINALEAERGPVPIRYCEDDEDPNA